MLLRWKIPGSHFQQEFESEWTNWVLVNNLAWLGLTWPGWLVCPVGQVAFPVCAFPRLVTDPDGRFPTPIPESFVVTKLFAPKFRAEWSDR